MEVLVFFFKKKRNTESNNANTIGKQRLHFFKIFILGSSHFLEKYFPEYYVIPKKLWEKKLNIASFVKISVNIVCLIMN
jgi:hypothetical protein